jgi:hypothetical protein
MRCPIEIEIEIGIGIDFRAAWAPDRRNRATPPHHFTAFDPDPDSDSGPGSPAPLRLMAVFFVVKTCKWIDYPGKCGG